LKRDVEPQAGVNIETVRNDSNTCQRSKKVTRVETDVLNIVNNCNVKEEVEKKNMGK
jgi:hypothetical protein